MARKSNLPADLPHLLPPEQRPGHAGLFHYEVTASGLDGVTVRITQRAPLADPRVNSVSLTFNAQMEETDKAYSLVGVAYPVHVSPQGVHSRISRLELFPLDPTELETAARSQTTSMPALPVALSALASANLVVAPGTTLADFQQEDFFGRPIRVLWRQGDPWPAYMSTINGAAVLIKGGQQ